MTTRPAGRRITRATVATVIGAVILAATAACGTTHSPLPTDAEPLPPATAAAVLAGTTTAPTQGCGNPRASLVPPDPMPAPGDMPAGSFMRTIQDRGYLVVGVIPDVPPFGIVNPQTNQLEGFDVDMAKEMAAAIFGPGNPKIRFRAITNAERIPAVQHGLIDIAIATMTITCDRRRDVDFSAVYYDSGQRVLVRRDSGFRRIEDLAGRKVCAAARTTSIQAIATVSPAPIPYPVTNVADCLVALQQGVVDGISTDDGILTGIVDQDPYTMIVGPRFTDEPHGMAVNKDHPDFTRFLNGALETIEKNGRWTEIYRRWLTGPGTEPVPAPPVPEYQG
ncbi:glutamate ABC transporter substrate-binding protein [Frankia sp. Cas4]|uniref:glutamate ABC transporter substrate-binding protein n=1 Tax=Frankia sp. Cas4 TaxID=3073927 RepID=UPI002AD472EB|nr:glutamate ABC transporter substrate-binding protein [Frankia sp. Cas4]